MRLPFRSTRRGSAEAEDGRRAAPRCPRTRLVTPWQLAELCEEEVYRATRYGRSLSLLVVELAATGDRAALQEKLTQWLQRRLRRADAAAQLSDGRYAVLLPEAGPNEASRVAARLRSAVKHIETSVSSHPHDGADLGALTAAARERLLERTKRAA